MERSDWIAIAAAAISLISALISFYYSWRANKVAAAQERRSQQPIVYDYHDFTSVRRRDELIIGFLIVAVNKSDIDNSVSSATLAVTYSIEGITNTVSVRPYDGDDTPTSIGTSRLSVPIRIDGRQTVRGWLLFSITEHLLARAKSFESYELLLSDSSGRVAGLKPTIVRMT